MALTGELYIGGARVRTVKHFTATNPATNDALPTAFSAAGAEHVDAACAAAEAAFDAYRSAAPEARARFLEAIAANIEALGDELITHTEAETGLPRARLEGERGRTAGQLRLFADLIRRGDWNGARLDSALPDRKPLPRADLRQRKIPLGPVAVFGASNFPLAFSVAGGDTASALAAGCPVIVKGHPAHPGASELVAGAIVRAAAETGMPAGVFSLLSGVSNDLGAALAADPRIKAVGFTGSRGGGLALVRIAQARAEPIPVYAEMSSINPVVLAPHALEARTDSLAAGFVGSLTMGAGQFCTNPGLLLALDGPALTRFIDAAARALENAPAGLMLTPRIYDSYAAGVAALGRSACVETHVRGGASGEANRGRGALFSVKAADFLKDAHLREEVFGASSVVVRCADENELRTVLDALEGQLTATLHIDADDHDFAARLLPILERKAGRILANGWPTGVEVCHAMVHGGPFPSTSDGRSTSVGTLAIERYLRPVCYQDIPEALLPSPLRSDNPHKLTRLVDGEIQKT